MKKIFAAILLITLLLSSTAVGDGFQIQVFHYVQFLRNKEPHLEANRYSKTSTAVMYGSVGFVQDIRKNDWIFVQLSEYGTEGNFEDDKGRFWGGWFKWEGLYDIGSSGDIRVHFLGDSLVGAALPGDVYKDPSNKNHVKATASVWLNKTYNLSQNYGKALKKGQKVKYRHLIGIDKRGVKFYAVRYEGKCLWVSSKYSKRVK